MTNERVNEKQFSSCFKRGTVITAENVKHIGEIIAVSAMKKVMYYCNNKLNDLYAGLIHDVFDYKSISESYSDGYDIACEAIALLCEHIGDSIDKVVKTDKKGREITVLWACYRATFNYIEKQKRHVYNTTYLNRLPLSQEPYIDFEDMQKKKDNENNVEVIIDEMQLNKGQLETLNCYMAGMRFVEIAKFLSVNNATVWKRRQQLQQKYNNCVVIRSNYIDKTKTLADSYFVD